MNWMRCILNATGHVTYIHMCNFRMLEHIYTIWIQNNVTKETIASHVSDNHIWKIFKYDFVSHTSPTSYTIQTIATSYVYKEEWKKTINNKTALKKHFREKNSLLCSLFKFTQNSMQQATAQSHNIHTHALHATSLLFSFIYLPTYTR